MNAEQLKTWSELGTVAGIFAVAIMARIDAYRAGKQRKEVLDVTKSTAETTDAIHVLSNSNMEAQLRVVWLQAKQIADLVRKTGQPSAIADEVAKEAERAYNEHRAKQLTVDSGLKIVDNTPKTGTAVK